MSTPKLGASKGKAGAVQPAASKVKAEGQGAATKVPKRRGKNLPQAEMSRDEIVQAIRTLVSMASCWLDRHPDDTSTDRAQFHALREVVDTLVEARARQRTAKDRVIATIIRDLIAEKVETMGLSPRSEFAQWRREVPFDAPEAEWMAAVADGRTVVRKHELGDGRVLLRYPNDLGVLEMYAVGETATEKIISMTAMAYCVLTTGSWIHWKTRFPEIAANLFGLAETLKGAFAWGHGPLAIAEAVVHLVIDGKLPSAGHLGSARKSDRQIDKSRHADNGHGVAAIDQGEYFGANMQPIQFERISNAKRRSVAAALLVADAVGDGDPELAWALYNVGDGIVGSLSWEREARAMDEVVARPGRGSKPNKA